MHKLSNIKLAVVGLGYVGLPLALAFEKKFPTVGFDISEKRVEELLIGFDRTCETTSETLLNITNLKITSDENELSDRNCFIITVPTPIDANNRPDLQPLISATKLVAAYLKIGDVVIYESTVFPGATEEECVPILEEISGLKYNQDFFCGYSPERINPGDKTRTLQNIVKITSGSTPEISDFIASLYEQVVSAGIFKASSIKVAEAAKVIENTQRDLNIALINELAMIFDRLAIDTNDVLAAANTKWNFLDFKPGLVGGHCIGVDPYYLTFKAESVGMHPFLIAAGRRINDYMPGFVALKFLKQCIKAEINPNHAQILILGATFKEDCPDTRNSKVVDLVTDLNNFGFSVDIYDPIADAGVFLEEYELTLIPTIPKKYYDGVILAVGHAEFNHLIENDLRIFCKSNSLIYDLKNMMNKNSGKYKADIYL